MFRTLDEEELFQAIHADLIFALDTGQGVGEEIARYSGYPTIAEKIVVLSHERFRGASSFAAGIRSPLCVEWYSDVDFDSCRLAKHLCTRHIYSLALRRLVAKSRI
jgi:hypothetical protein